MKRTMLAVGLMVVGGVAWGAECQGPDGNWYDYGSPQCGGSGGGTGEPSSASSGEERIIPSRAERSPEELAENCMQGIKFRFKDPESLRADMVGGLNLEVVEYASTKMLAYKLPIWVNAKNSYGAYSGKTLYYCYLDQHSKKVLGMEQIGKD